MRRVLLFFVFSAACAGCGSVDSMNNRGYIISQSEKEEPAVEAKPFCEELH